MTVGSWNPDQQSAGNIIDSDFLQRCLGHVQAGELQDLNNAMTEEDRQQSQYMHAEQSRWDSALEPLQDEQLLDLIRFFTIAEMKLPGWQAGSQSPVIAINRLLKRRGHKLDREMLQWIRENSDNRFIPNGAVL